MLEDPARKVLGDDGFSLKSKPSPPLEPFMPDLVGDFRYALRSFRHAPLHASLTVIILGVGIGAVTLMFSAMNASVLRPLPYPDPDRLVWAWKASDQVSQNSLSYDDFRDYEDGLSAVQDVGAFFVFRPQVLVTGTEEAERVQSTLVTTDFFRTLGVPPALGRPFLPEESVLGGPAVAILSDAFWESRFGGGRDITDQTITIDGTVAEIVGVMPPGFEFRGGVEIWLPAQEGAGYTEGRGNNNFFFVGRLREGVTLQQAQAQVDGVGRQIQEANPDFASWHHWLQPLHDVFYGDMRTVFLVLMGIVALVPLLACANVASLSLARATTRNTELATRLALGAERRRILRQLLVESLLLALMGGLLGVGLAVGGGNLLRSLGPAGIPRLDEIGLDGPVLAFGLIVSLLTVPLFGILPALRGTDFDLARVLRSGGRGVEEGGSRAQSMLVIAQVALSMTLLISSGLLFRSFRSLQGVDPGFDVESVLTAGVQLPAFKYGDPQEVALAWETTLSRLRAIPGVAGVAGADWLPVSPGGGPWNSLSRPDHPLEGYDQGVPATRKFVSNDYFSVLGVPMRAGRAFTVDDRVGTPPAMVLSEALAQILFPDEDPLGRPVTLWDEPFQVVGVARDVAEEGLGVVGRPTFFIATGQFPLESLQLMIRMSGTNPQTGVTALREALKEQDSEIAITDVQTMAARVSGTLAQPRFRTALVGAFALTGLLLAAFGLYGVLAFLVTRRRHEIGIRMAVGAQSRNVVGLVLRHGLGLVGVGAALGLVGGGIAALFLRRMLFGVSVADPLTLGGSSLILLLVAMGASILPAWKAAKVDPLESLRAE
jgi:putative ABC transport system permease protein